MRMISSALCFKSMSCFRVKTCCVLVNQLKCLLISMMQILAPWTILSYQRFDNSLKNIPEYLTIGFHEPVRAVSNILLAREWNFNYYCSLFFLIPQVQRQDIQVEGCCSYSNKSIWMMVNEVVQFQGKWGEYLDLKQK